MKDSSILNSLRLDRYQFVHIGVVLAWVQLTMMLATGLSAESPNQQNRIRTSGSIPAIAFRTMPREKSTDQRAESCKKECWFLRFKA